LDSLGLTWIHLESLGLTWYHLVVLKSPANHIKSRASETNGTGEQLGQRKATSGRELHQITPRTHQNASDHTITHPEHMQHHRRTHRGTWIHVDSPNLIDLTWLSLKPQQITLKTELARPTAPGDQRDERHRGISGENPKIHQEISKSPPGPTRRLQNPSRKHQRCSRSSQNNFLFRFPTKSSTNPKGTPEPRSTNRTPEPQPQDHARRSH
jgi:hypothetical protein